ncbi:response regulator [Iningainema sp. BLCCT55]|uniref:Response regulator n=2 Tax=Iningainema TaxID=1932705 RepID=A0A8J6XHW6_9CYAN|nr:response regulator [Iningainema tapete BLCC-T55]
MNQFSTNQPSSEFSTTARILIVDDRYENCLALQAIMEREGYQVEIAQSGSSALSVIEAFAPEIILLELIMSGMDGYEVTRLIRQNTALPFIPILLITAHDSPNVARGFDLGANDFIRKPVTVDELLARVRALLRLKRTIDEHDAKAKNSNVLAREGLQITANQEFQTESTSDQPKAKLEVFNLIERTLLDTWETTGFGSLTINSEGLKKDQFSVIVQGNPTNRFFIDSKQVEQWKLQEISQTSLNSIDTVFSQIKDILFNIWTTTGYGSLTIDSKKIKQDEIRVIIQGTPSYRFIINSKQLQKWKLGKTYN